jgi:hypothetical protein
MLYKVVLLGNTVVYWAIVKDEWSWYTQCLVYFKNSTTIYSLLNNSGYGNIQACERKIPNREQRREKTHHWTETKETEIEKYI